MLKTSHKLLNTDSRKLPEIDTESIDLVVTSPPYPMIEMWDTTFQKMNDKIDAKLVEKAGVKAFELMHVELDKVVALWPVTLDQRGLLSPFPFVGGEAMGANGVRVVLQK